MKIDITYFNQYVTAAASMAFTYDFMCIVVILCVPATFSSDSFMEYVTTIVAAYSVFRIPMRM